MKRKWTDQDLRDAVKDAITLAEVIRKLKLCFGNGSYRSLNHWIKKLDIDTSHFKGCGHGLSRPKGTYTDDVVYSINSPVRATALKRRILRDKVIPYVCAICGQEPFWRGQPLVLILDHINGDHGDHRKENLRFLCPNCDSQQPTFSRMKKSLAKQRGC